jgi:hypothetical protein
MGSGIPPELSDAALLARANRAVLAQAADQPTGGEAVAANAVTGLQSGVGNLLGAPNAIGTLADRIGTQLFGTSPEPGWLARHTYSPEDINSALYKASGAVNRAVGLPEPQPYVPQTPEGRLGQNVLGAVVPSLVGNLAGLLPRLAAGTAGTTAATAYGERNPDDPTGQLLVGLLGGAGGAGLLSATRSVGNKLGQPLMPERYAKPAVAQELTTAAGQRGTDLAALIDQKLPDWTPGTLPTTANVTENTGLRNLEYGDQAAAARTGDTTYQANQRATNVAQRQAIAAVTPDTAQTIEQLTADRDAAVNAIPQGTTAQDAGRIFRENLQRIQEQRQATRAAGGSAFDALDASPAQVNLRPVMDYATEQAAKQAGEVGQAYSRAGDQFKSATGITLETAPFSNSVLKGLKDLADSYQQGSAAQRAVLDVKGRLEAHLGSEVPEIGAARSQWEANSRPLDVFEAKPFAQVLATDRFGRSYAMPNDAVASSFLRGSGAADALDRLNGIFGSPEAATGALQDYLAGQVRQHAVKADGSIDQAALARAMQPYQAALMRFPDLQKMFSTADQAQGALSQQLARQKIYDTFRTGAGTMEQDAAGNPMYSPSQFGKAVDANRPLLEQAYGKDGVAVIDRVNTELDNIAQTAYAKVKGQSGTPQAMAMGGKSESGLGGMAGTVLLPLLAHIVGAGEHGTTMALIGKSVGEVASKVFGAGNEAVARATDSIRRQALTDPVYARNLLMSYDPKLPASASRRALNYVLSRTPGYVAAAESAKPPIPAAGASPAMQFTWPQPPGQSQGVPLQ